MSRNTPASSIAGYALFAAALHGQPDTDDGAFADATADANSAVMLFHQFTGYPQAKPSSKRFLGGEEWLEYPFFVLFCNARPGIADTQDDHGAVVDAHGAGSAEKQGATLRHRVDAVDHEI